MNLFGIFSKPAWHAAVLVVFLFFLAIFPFSVSAQTTSIPSFSLDSGNCSMSFNNFFLSPNPKNLNANDKEVIFLLYNPVKIENNPGNTIGNFVINKSVNAIQFTSVKSGWYQIYSSERTPQLTKPVAAICPPTPAPTKKPTATKIPIPSKASAIIPTSTFAKTLPVAKVSTPTPTRNPARGKGEQYDSCRTDNDCISRLVCSILYKNCVAPSPTRTPTRTPTPTPKPTATPKPVATKAPTPTKTSTTSVLTPTSSPISTPITPIAYPTVTSIGDTYCMASFDWTNQINNKEVYASATAPHFTLELYTNTGGLKPQKINDYNYRTTGYSYSTQVAIKNETALPYRLYVCGNRAPGSSIFSGEKCITVSNVYPTCVSVNDNRKEIKSADEYNNWISSVENLGTPSPTPTLTPVPATRTTDSSCPAISIADTDGDNIVSLKDFSKRRDCAKKGALTKQQLEDWVTGVWKPAFLNK